MAASQVCLSIRRLDLTDICHNLEGASDASMHCMSDSAIEACHQARARGSTTTDHHGIYSVDDIFIEALVGPGWRLR